MTDVTPIVPRADFRQSLNTDGYVSAEKPLAVERIRPLVEKALQSALEHRALPEPVKRAAATPEFLELCVDNFLRLYHLSDFQKSEEPLPDRVVQSALYQLAAGTDARVAWSPQELQQSLTREGRHLVAVGARCGCANEKVIPALFGITSGAQFAMNGHQITIVMPFECAPKPLTLLDEVLSQLASGNSLFHADGRPDVPVVASFTTTKEGELRVNGMVRHGNIHGSSNPVQQTDLHVRALLVVDNYWPQDGGASCG
ncbi:MAG: hypothetical protein AAF654_08175 [Myxococcota bacterium]